MPIEIKVPELPESIADATVVTWHVKEGERVATDTNLIDLETDKVVLEVPAPEDGAVLSLLKKEGDVVLSGEVLATFEAGAGAVEKASVAADLSKKAEHAKEQVDEDQLSPTVRRLIAEHDLSVNVVKGTGKDGRITKKDVESYLQSQNTPQSEAPSVEKTTAPTALGVRGEKRVPMTRLRQRIAERLVSAQQNAAMLTTFNEVDLSQVMDLRKKYKEKFEEKHGVRLGYLSFFTKAVINALKQFPSINASIDGTDIVYHDYFDVGIAISSDRGLVVPVLRDADQMSMAQIEAQIIDYAKKARSGKLALEDMTGGNFTITNGGVFGSMLSMPILNAPQSAILGMHAIKERPVVVDGEIVIRPMMYLALTYDHRIVDGKESVTFLVNLKEHLEDTNRFFLDV